MVSEHAGAVREQIKFARLQNQQPQRLILLFTQILKRYWLHNILLEEKWMKWITSVVTIPLFISEAVMMSSMDSELVQRDLGKSLNIM